MRAIRVLLAVAVTVACCLPICAAALTQDKGAAGSWSGTFKTDKPSGTMELTVTRESEVWKCEARFVGGGKDVSGAVTDFEVDGSAVTFSSEIEGAQVKFVGKLEGDRLGGSMEAYENGAKVASGTWDLTRR
jgi:hypothetical protein